jgi:uncharacterized cupredoxin-like copper-binding protein
MAVYFVIGGVLVAWALVLTFGGMARVSEGPDKRGGRALMAVSGALCIGASAALMVTTKKEHPREEAKEKAAEKAAEERPAGETAGGTFRLKVNEDEYSIKLAREPSRPGGYAFEVANSGKIEHDLAVEGEDVERKTPLIDPGKQQTLEVDLKPGKYKLYCTVPGHEQLGMKSEVTVR